MKHLLIAATLTFAGMGAAEAACILGVTDDYIGCTDQEHALDQQIAAQEQEIERRMELQRREMERRIQDLEAEIRLNARYPHRW